MEQIALCSMLTCSSMVATEMAKLAFESLKPKGIDLAPLAVSVEQSCQDILRVASQSRTLCNRMLTYLSKVNNATLERTHGKFLGPDGAELPW